MAELDFDVAAQSCKTERQKRLAEKREVFSVLSEGKEGGLFISASFARNRDPGTH